AGIGHVVNTASAAGLATNVICGMYAARKHAVVGLSEALYRELEDTPIGVSCLCPNVVSTAIFDVGRLRPDWVEVHGSGEDLQNSLSGTVANRVVEAVRTGKFWVLTHHETVPKALLRFEDLKANRNPSPNPGDMARLAVEKATDLPDR
ncbi:MAG: SDR family NAD(P)-dependent oxidoreductase, partial [Dehalococcoidia bacterium]|nr:SDR family NAD(P)-dependent oxidoreductase [Dehalococcoidia bacterium]